MSNEPASASALQRQFLLLVVALVSLLFLWMIRHFLLALLVAALAAGLVMPIYRRLVVALRGRSILAAALLVAGTLLLVVGPLTTLLGLVVAQAIEVSQAATPWVQAQLKDPDQLFGMLDHIPFVERLNLEALLPDRDRLISTTGEVVKSAGAVLVTGVAAAGRLTALFLLQLFIFLYAMFFFLLQGRAVLNLILYYAPLDPDYEREVVGRFVSVTKATLKGSLAIGALQGLLAGAAFAIAGIQGAAFWGTIMMVLSVIPGLGAPLVWLPAVIWLFATGEMLTGILLGGWCAGVVGSIDNVLRPRLVGGDAKMSDLLILLSTLGGIALFGAVGFVVGPIVAAVFVTLWDVYGRVFADVLPPGHLPPIVRKDPTGSGNG